MAAPTDPGIHQYSPEELLRNIGPLLPDHFRDELIDKVMGAHRDASIPTVMKHYPQSVEQMLANVAYDPYTDSPTANGMQATDYMKALAESMDSIKEVLTYMSAVDAMEIFKSNPRAAGLYRRIITAGLQTVFQKDYR